MTKYKTTPREKTIIKLMEMVIDTLFINLPPKKM